MTTHSKVKENVKNITIKFEHDGDASHPYHDNDNMGTIVTWHRNYTIGEKHNFSEPRDFLESIVSDKFTEDQLYNMSDEKLFEEVEKLIIILPLYMYEHGNVALSMASFSDKWDSGRFRLYLYYKRASKARIQR